MIALASQKGGVGKTTTAVNLGVQLARRGQRTLVVDFDPQASASQVLGMTGEQLNELGAEGGVDLRRGLQHAPQGAAADPGSQGGAATWCPAISTWPPPSRN